MGWLFKTKKKRIVGGPIGTNDYRSVLLKPVDYLEYESGGIFKNIEIASVNLHTYSGQVLNQTIVKGYEKLPSVINRAGSEEEKAVFDKCYGQIDAYNLVLAFLLNSMIMNKITGRLSNNHVEWPGGLSVSSVANDFRSLSEHQIVEEYIEPLMAKCSTFRTMFTKLGYRIEVYKE